MFCSPLNIESNHQLKDAIIVSLHIFSHIKRA